MQLRDPLLSVMSDDYEREQVYEEAKEASAAARAPAEAAEGRRPKPLDKGGGMWPAERVIDFGASLVHRVRKAVMTSTSSSTSRGVVAKEG